LSCRFYLIIYLLCGRWIAKFEMAGGTVPRAFLSLSRW
jgi:hypothetical protein